MEIKGSFFPQNPHQLFMAFVFILQKENIRWIVTFFFVLFCFLHTLQVSCVLSTLRAVLMFLIYYTWNSICFEKISFVTDEMIEHADSLLCLRFGNTLNNSRILFSWKNIDQVFENTWLVSLTRWLRLYFFMLSFICLWNLNMPRLDKEILDCIYLRLSKIMLDRTAYLLTGGRNAVNCSEDCQAIRIPW